MKKIGMLDFKDFLQRMFHTTLHEQYVLCFVNKDFSFIRWDEVSDNIFDFFADAMGVYVPYTDIVDYSLGKARGFTQVEFVNTSLSNKIIEGVAFCQISELESWFAHNVIESNSERMLECGPPNEDFDDADYVSGINSSYTH